MITGCTHLWMEQVRLSLKCIDSLHHLIPCQLEAAVLYPSVVINSKYLYTYATFVNHSRHRKLLTHRQTKDFQVRPPTCGNAEFSVFNVASRNYSLCRHIEGSMINSISELLYGVTLKS